VPAAAATEGSERQLPRGPHRCGSGNRGIQLAARLLRGTAIPYPGIAIATIMSPMNAPPASSNICTIERRIRLPHPIARATRGGNVHAIERSRRVCDFTQPRIRARPRMRLPARGTAKYLSRHETDERA
jgi:hypothetical protein